MSAPLRFLGLAIIAYVGLRTAGSALALEPIVAPATMPSVATLPPGVPADMGPPPSPYGYGYPAAAPAQPYALVPYPVMPATMPAPRQSFLPAPYPYPPPYPYPAPPAPEAPEPAPASFGYEGGESPPLEQWPAIGTTGPFSVGRLQQTPSWGRSPVDVAGQSRWSLDSWALLRPPRSGLLSVDDPARGLNPGLASAGSLGGSQAGLRFTWRPLNRVGVHVRASTALMPQGRGGQAMPGGEAAAGVSWQPLASLPVRLVAERRQRLGSPLGGGRNAFALLAEGGVHDRELPPTASASTATVRPAWSELAAATCSPTARSPPPTPSCRASRSAEACGAGSSPACPASMPGPGSATSCRRDCGCTSTIASA